MKLYLGLETKHSECIAISLFTGDGITNKANNSVKCCHYSSCHVFVCILWEGCHKIIV